MEREKFEAELFKFVCEDEYHKAEEALLTLVRAAFSAGWCAARYQANPTDETPLPR